MRYVTKLLIMVNKVSWQYFKLMDIDWICRAINSRLWRLLIEDATSFWHVALPPRRIMVERCRLIAWNWCWIFHHVYWHDLGWRMRYGRHGWGNSLSFWACPGRLLECMDGSLKTWNRLVRQRHIFTWRYRHQCENSRAFSALWNPVIYHVDSRWYFPTSLHFPIFPTNARGGVGLGAEWADLQFQIARCTS